MCKNGEKYYTQPVEKSINKSRPRNEQMVEIADNAGKTAIVNILHIFKNIKENMNMMRIEMVLRGKHYNALVLEKQKGLNLIKLPS